MVGNGGITRWPFGIAGATLTGLTLQEAVVRANAAGLNGIEAANTLKVSAQNPKNLDYNLSPTEIQAARQHIGGGVNLRSYRVDSFGANAETRRKVFEFAKALGANTIVGPAAGAPASELDTLAGSLELNVVLTGRPEAVMTALQGRSERLKAGLDTGLLMEAGVAPLAGIAAVKDKLAYVSLRDRSVLGAGGRNVLLGQGAGKLSEFFLELNRLGVRPLILTLDATGTINQPADIFKAVDAFEAVVQPAYGAFFTELSKSKPAPRLYLDERSRTVGRGDNRQQLTEEEIRRRIAAAIREAPKVEPRKPRKLLVMESLQGMYHNPGIPNCNVMLDLMGDITGAWETEFSNDLNNLKYPKIKDYDAVFINSAVNEMFPDVAVREGLSRFVKEGGGLGGIHGTPWASRNWQEFADMIGSRSAPHRIEPGVIKLYDPASPLVKSFGGKDLDFTEEFYRFERDGYNRLMWENMRVVLSVETQTRQENAWMGNNYPLTWIRSYGAGRTFYCSLGHMAETFMQPEIVGHLFSGMQFLLGDLEVDTTPNPPTIARP